MKKKKLDTVDYQILRLIQDNARITNSDLSKKTGISAPPTLRRLRALENEGVIEGYHAKINKDALGYEVVVWALVGLKNQSEDDLRAFEKVVWGWPLVRECHMLSGEVDFILKCVAKNLTDFKIFLADELTAAPNVSNVKTSLEIRKIKELPGIPLE